MNTQRKENQHYLGCINGIRYFGSMQERGDFKILFNMITRSLNTGKKPISTFTNFKIKRIDNSPRAFWH